MKFKTTIILLIIAGIGAAYIFLDDKKTIQDRCMGTETTNGAAGLQTGPD